MIQFDKYETILLCKFDKYDTKKYKDEKINSDCSD